MKSADVNAAFPQNCADAANHSGHVAIVHHQHITLRNRFNAKSVDLSDPAMAGIRITEDGSGNSFFRIAGYHSRLNRRYELAGAANV